MNGWKGRIRTDSGFPRPVNNRVPYLFGAPSKKRNRCGGPSSSRTSIPGFSSRCPAGWTTEPHEAKRERERAMDASEGFEPPYAASETAVLPLDELATRKKEWEDRWESNPYLRNHKPMSEPLDDGPHMMVRTAGVEPATSRVSDGCSNQSSCVRVSPAAWSRR